MTKDQITIMYEIAELLRLSSTTITFEDLFLRILRANRHYVDNIRIMDMEVIDGIGEVDVVIEVDNIIKNITDKDFINYIENFKSATIQSYKDK